MDRIAVVGAGVMGRGIAQVAAAAGHDVLVLDVTIDRATAAVDFAANMLRRTAEKGQMSREAAEAAVARMQPCAEMAQVRDVSLVIEAAAEDLAIKQQLFRQLETVVDDSAVLATNTSSLTVTQIASACRRPERVAGLHFFNPVPLMKLVEVIPGALTTSEVVERLQRFVDRIGHARVLAADAPGFLVNHAGRAFYTEGIRIVSEGIASAADVDRVSRESLGFRMGPFELFDLTGLDVSYNVLTQIYHQFFEEPRFRPHPLLTRQYLAGLYGRKIGRGFYRYEDGKRVDEPEKSAPDGAERSVWIAEQGECRRKLREFFGGHGIGVDDERTPQRDSVVVVSPSGEDATAAATRLGLPLERTMAVDTFVWPTKRVCLMPSVATGAAWRDSLHGMLGRRGVPVTCIHDSPGFVGQRMLASIVNLACDIAQQRIASPEDIDRAVRLGLGYPQGPLEWGNALGPRRVLEILTNLFEFYGDARYRPSPWLKRRALADVPLQTPDP